MIGETVTITNQQVFAYFHDNLYAYTLLTVFLCNYK